MKYDFKKMATVEFNSTKRPKQVVVPSHSYFEIHGKGNPNDALFPDYIAALYSVVLMSRLWTGFFGTERCRTPKIFQNPDFSLKRRDFWVFL